MTVARQGESPANVRSDLESCEPTRAPVVSGGWRTLTAWGV